MVPMKDGSLFSLQSYAVNEASLEYTEASAMSQELLSVGKQAFVTAT